MSRAPFCLALAQFPVARHADWSAFEQTLEAWFASAAAHEARLLVFPEYAAMSLASLLGSALEADLLGQLHGLQELREAYVELHRRLAQQHGCHVVAGSFPWRIDDGSYRNRAFVLAPDGGVQHQDKQLMTRFEREIWGISGCDDLRVFETELGCLGVQICYDSEFPLLARAQVEAGAELICVPSCTDTAGGYHRVRVGAQARALEGQCYVAQSPLVGEAPWSPAVDVNVGAAGLYGPPDRGFPDDGVVARGEYNTAQWLFAEVDLANVALARATGQVFNHRHWPEQPHPALARRCPL